MRRQKVEAMRKQMTGDGSSAVPPAKPPRIFAYGNAEKENEAGVSAQETHDLGSKEGSSNVSVNESSAPDEPGHEHAESVKAQDSEGICDNVQSSKETQLKTASGECEDSPIVETGLTEAAAASGTTEHEPQEQASKNQQDFLENLNVNCPEVDRNMQGKDILQLVALESNLEQLEAINRTQVMPALEEPDIIQITKPTAPVAPVAPPRNRRRTKNKASPPPPPAQVS